jgi:Ion channel
MTALTAEHTTGAGRREAQHRYGVVFLLVLALLLFEVIAPAGSGTRAVDVALSGAALSVAVLTSRARGRVRRSRSRGVAALALLFVIFIASGLFGRAITFLVVTVLVACIPVALVGGLLRLVRQAGVTFQVVAGALTIYLVVGLLFASIIGFTAVVESGPYFKQGPVTTGGLVYYSFTVLTTTGFGDYTAAQPFGRALAVLEMLMGQLYLVTVIGIVVGNFAGRRSPGTPPDQGSQRNLEAT